MSVVNSTDNETEKDGNMKGNWYANRKFTIYYFLSLLQQSNISLAVVENVFITLIR